MNKPWLTVRARGANQIVQERRFSQDRVTIGRDPGSDFVVDADSSVSRCHLEVYRGEPGQRAMLIDAGSSHGTFYYGVPVKQLPLDEQQTYAIELGTSGCPIELVLEASQPAPGKGASNFATVAASAGSNPFRRARSPVPQVRVTVRAGGRTETYVFAQSVITLGRSRSCDVVFPEFCEEVSSRHARLLWNGEDLRARDMGSTNGLFHDRARVFELIIPEGQEIPLTFGHEGAQAVISMPRRSRPQRNPVQAMATVSHTPASPLREPSVGVRQPRPVVANPRVKTEPTIVVPNPSTSGDWLDSIEELDVRRLLSHIEAHGSVNEPEAMAMLGGGRRFRRFVRKLDQYERLAPFAIRVRVVNAIKVYVKEAK